MELEAGSDERERKVKEFMKKKEQQLKHSCQVDKRAEGAQFLCINLSCTCSMVNLLLCRLLPLRGVYEEPRRPESCRDSSYYV